jgi:hypothetical protein
MCVLTLVSKVGAVCGNPPGTDLCGGRRATVAPTATAKTQQPAQESTDATKEGDETRRQELHQAQVRRLNSKAA